MAKNDIQQQRAGLAERTRAGAGAAVVVALNPARSLDFFSSTFEKVSRWPVLEALNFQYRSRYGRHSLFSIVVVRVSTVHQSVTAILISLQCMVQVQAILRLLSP